MRYWDKQWHIINGCSHVSEACENCWLERQYKRCGWDFNNIKWNIEQREIPIKNKKPTTYLVLSDLFHELIKAFDITYTFEVMEACPQHTFIVCTKRPERISQVLYGQEGRFFLGGYDYIKNIWLGTTVENQEMTKRIPHLISASPFKLFLSIEPMLGNITIEPEWLRHINLVIAGCESGNKYKTRYTRSIWVENIKAQSIQARVPIYTKQMIINGKIADDLLHYSTIKKEDLFKS